MLCGIVVPHLSGLLCTEMTPDFYLIISYIYYTIMMWAIWEGNKYILEKYSSRISWTDNPIKRLMVLLSSYMLFSGIVNVLFCIAWYICIVHIHVYWPFVIHQTLITIILVLMVSHTFETIGLIQKSIRDKEISDSLELSFIKAELEALKNQVDPHFMFNCLNTLSYLIEHYPEKALNFTHNLAELYRYILSSKSKGNVTIESEMSFTLQYLELMNIRHGNCILFKVDESVQRHYNFKIPAISIQTIIENAIKHNEFNEQENLIIEMKIESMKILISNAIKQRTFLQRNSGTGLSNLNKRYQLLMGNSIDVSNSGSLFQVTLPIKQPTP